METSIEKLVALNFFVIGLSHILAPRAWVEFFLMLREKKEVGSLINGFVHFPLGAFIISFHNVWHGIPMIVTIIGWGLTFKSTLYFVWPRHGVRVLQTVKLDRNWPFVAGGALSVLLSAVIFYPHL